MRIGSDEMQILTASRKFAKKGKFSEGIAPSKYSIGQVQTKNSRIGRRKGAKQEERAAVIRSNLQTADRLVCLQEFCELYDFRADLSDKHPAVHAVITGRFH